VPVRAEMLTRIRLAEVLFSETENGELAEDVLSKGVLSCKVGC
jgi:Cohesin loading factor